MLSIPGAVPDVPQLLEQGGVGEQGGSLPAHLLAQHDSSHGDDEDQDVPTPGVVVGVETLLEPVHTGVDTILTHSL